MCPLIDVIDVLHPGAPSVYCIHVCKFTISVKEKIGLILVKANVFNIQRYTPITVDQTLKSPAHTMRFLSSVGRRDDEKTIVAWCVRTKDDRRPFQTRQLLDRFEKRIGPTTVAWCVRVNDIRRIN